MAYSTVKLKLIKGDTEPAKNPKRRKSFSRLNVFSLRFTLNWSLFAVYLILDKLFYGDVFHGAKSFQKRREIQILENTIATPFNNYAIDS